MIKVKRIRVNFQVRFGYIPALTEYIKTIPKDQVQTKMEPKFVEGKNIEDWFRICNIAGLSKILMYAKNNNIAVEYENIKPGDIERIENFANNKLKNIEAVKKIKEEGVDVSKIDYSFMKLPPYEYQKIAAEFFDAAGGKALLGDQPGVGKSLSAILYAVKHKLKTLIVCPASLKLNWRNEILRFTHEKAFVFKYTPTRKEKKAGVVNFDPDESLFHIINYESLRTYLKFDVHHKCSIDTCGWEETNKIKKYKECPSCFRTGTIKSRNVQLESFSDKKGKQLDPSMYELVVLDECFTYETLVTTIYGEMKIGDIVEYKIDVPILSFNLEKKNFEYKTINRWISKDTNSNLIKINFNNNYIICTPNHKIYTYEEGYITADKITEKHTMHILYYTPNKKTNSPQMQILFFKMLSFTQKRRWSKIIRKSEMCVVQYKIYLQKVKSSKILQSILFCKMEDVTTRNKKSSLYRKSITENVSCNKSKLSKESSKSDGYFFKNETKKSNEKPFISRENEIISFWTNIFISWRKWKNYFTTTKTIRSLKRWLDDGIFNWIKERYAIFSKPSNSLFCGFSLSGKENNYRSRWKNAFNKKMEIFGQKKNCSFRKIRVDSVEILESRDRFGHPNSTEKNTTVYNLEIADNHNYYANNVLVSNCHALKEQTTTTTKTVKSALKSVPRKILMTGTAIKNRPKEFFSLLNFLDEYEWVNFHNFGVRYCDGKKDKFDHWDYDGYSNLQELYDRISYLFLRRLKKDVLKFLPDKTFTVIPIELSTEEAREYKNLEEDIVEEAKITDEPVSHLARVQKLKQFTSKVNSHRAIEFIQNIIDGDEKIVVFTQFLSTADFIHNHFRDCAVLYNGSKNQSQKQAAVDMFMNDENCKVFVGTSAAYVGITLTSASVALFIDHPWDPSTREQAEDRIHRASQKSDHVQIIRLIAQGTIDEDINRLLDEKAKITSQVMDGEEVTNKVEFSIFNDIVNIILAKKFSN